MLVAVKSNREVKIDEKDKEEYLNSGYDVLEIVKGKVTKRTSSPSKQIPYTQYKALLDEKMKLEKENKRLKSELKK